MWDKYRQKCGMLWSKKRERAIKIDLERVRMQHEPHIHGARIGGMRVKKPRDGVKKINCRITHCARKREEGERERDRTGDRDLDQY